VAHLRSFRKRLSFPDNPYWEGFRAPVDDGGHIIGIYRDHRESSKWSTNVALDQLSHPPVCGIDNSQSHHYAKCWGLTQHPLQPIHNLIAETAYYFLAVEVAAATVMMPTCKERGATFKRALPSASAMRLRSILDPHSSCPKGPLAQYSSAAIFASGAAVGPNTLSHWAVLQDRPGKFGWILEGASGDYISDTISFNLTLSAENPHVTVGYMHSYEGMGAARFTLTQGPSQEELPAVYSPQDFEDSHFGFEAIGPTASPVVDSFVPEIHNALYTEVSFQPSGLSAGPAVLHATLLRLSDNELAKRGGDKFKITSVQSC